MWESKLLCGGDEGRWGGGVKGRVEGGVRKCGKVWGSVG